MSNSFINGKPRIATEEECRMSWSGKKDGKGFGCKLCGHIFKSGDYYRFQYLNDNAGWYGKRPCLF